MANSENLNLIRTRLKALISPYHDVTDEDLSLILYERHDLFKNFIQWTLSKMDDELGEYLGKSQKLQRELITILHELQITNTDEKNKFVMGGLSKEQQFVVWLRLLDAVECVLTFEEKPEVHGRDIEDIIFKEKQTNLLSSVHCLPNSKEKILSLEEVELLLQDANAKLEQLENVIADQTTMEIKYNSMADHNMETTVASLHEKLAEFRNILAEYDVEPLNETKLHQSSDDNEVISVAKIKEISDKISSANLFLSYLNTRGNVVEKPTFSFEVEENLHFKEISAEFIQVCKNIEKLKHSF